jgi:hypothetical protein
MAPKHPRPAGPHETAWAMLQQMAATAAEYIRRAERFSSENHHRIAVSRARLDRSWRVLRRIGERERHAPAPPARENKRPPQG